MKKNYTIRLESTHIDKLKEFAKKRSVNGVRCSYTSLVELAIESQLKKEEQLQKSKK